MTAETLDLAWACAGTAVIACQPFLILFFLFRKSLNAKAGFVAAASVGFVAMSTALFGAIAANSLSFSFLQLWKLVLVPPSFVVFYLLIRDRTPKILFFSAIVAAVIATTTKMGNYIALRFFEGSLYAGLAAAYVAVHILFTPPIMLYLDRIIQRTGGALEEYGKPIWKTIWIVPAVFLLINLLTNPRFDPDVSVTASFLIANAATVFGLLASCYVLFRAMGIADDAAQIQERARMAARQLDMQREQYERMAQDAEATKKMRHDLRHHLAVIGRLAEEGDAEKVKGYVDDLAGRAIALQEKTYCKNYAANAVAAHYLGIAEKEGVAVTASLKVPQDTGGVPAMDVCLILGNFLENALEACRRMERGDRFIRVHSRIDGDTLSLVVANSFDGAWRGENGAYLSCKGQGEKREGLGLASVKAVCEKHGGLVQFEITAGEWKSSALVHMGNAHMGNAHMGNAR